MKKPITITTIYYVLLILTLTSFGCKKTNDSHPTPAQANSQWTFNGSTYKVTDAYYSDTFDDLTASDDPRVVGGGNYVRIFFGSTLKPNKNITLNAVDIGTSLNPSICNIQVGNIYDTYYLNGHVSTGKAGDKVVITVSPAGKLTATFSNITVTDGPTGTDTKTVSGVIVEE